MTNELRSVFVFVYLILDYSHNTIFCLCNDFHLQAAKNIIFYYKIIVLVKVYFKKDLNLLFDMIFSEVLNWIFNYSLYIEIYSECSDYFKNTHDVEPKMKDNKFIYYSVIYRRFIRLPHFKILYSYIFISFFSNQNKSKNFENTLNRKHLTYLKK